MSILFKRKFFLIFLTVVLFIVVLGLSYLFILNSQPFRAYLKPIIIKQLENNLGKSIHIEEIQSVSFNSLIFSNLIILEDTPTDKDIALLEAEKVTVNFRFTLPFPHFKNWQLDINQLTLQKANLNLQRNKQGDFDMVKNLNLQPEMIKNNFTFNKIYFKDSYLLFQDDSVYQIERLSTKVKKLNGFFNLNNLPEVEFEFNGLIEEDSSPITIQGYLFIDQPRYSLSCQLKNADMMHFQHYLNGFELLNLEKGRFDLQLVLNSDPALEPAKISWQGEASFQGVNLKPQFLNRIFLENAHGLIQFKESEVQINLFQGFFHNQPFYLQGTLSFQEIVNFDLDLKANDLPLNVLQEELEGYISGTSFSVRGDIFLDVNLTGNLNDFQVKGKLNSSLLNIDGWQLQNPNLLFSFKEEQLMIESLETQWEDTKIIIEGIIDWEKPSPVYQFFAKVEGLDLENSTFKKITFLDSFSGSLSGNFIIEGTLLANSPINLTGQLTAQEVKLLKNKLQEPITTQLEMKIINSSSFELNKLALSYLHNQFNLSGKLDSKNKLDFQFNSEYISLEDFSFLFNLNELRGIGNITGKIQGTTSQPQIESRFELKNVNWENLAVDNFEGEISYQFPFLQFKEIILDNNSISLTADGQVDLQKDSQKQVDVTLQLSRLDMNYLTELFAFEESLSGWAHGFANLQGNWPDISLDSQLDLEEISLKNYYLGKGNFHFKLAPTKIPSENTSLSWQKNFSDWITNNYQLTIEELSFKQAEMQINTQGKADLKQERGQFLAKGWLELTQNFLDIEFQAIEFDLNDLAQLIEFKEDIKGNLNVIGTYQGSLKHPSIAISVQIEDGYFRNFKFENLQSKINWKDGNLEIQELIISYQKDYQIKAQGKIPFPFIVSEKKEDQDQDLNQLPLNFKVSLENTDLSFIQIFWDKNFKQAQGITNLILNLSGTIGEPIFNGHLTLNQGSLELSSIPIKLDKIETKVEIVNNLVKIPQMTFLLDNNLIYISGDFKLVNFQPDDLRIKIWNEGGKLIYGDILTAHTNFQAEINGTIDFPQIKGEFIFSEGELNWIPGYQLIPEKTDSLMHLKGRVDLSAKILKNFQFKAPNLDLELDGEIKIQGDLPQPIFTGQLTVRKGYFMFLEQKFQFTEGKLLLNEFTGPDVLLDIKANTKISQVTVFLKISGNLSAPQISLSSQPALSEAEIISLLTLNKNISGLSEGEIGELLRGEIFDLIFQGLSINFLRRAENQIANYLGLDVFRIETIFKGSGETTPSYDLNFKTFGIEVGKSITEDLFLTYSTSLDGFSERSFGIDYQFKPDLSFTAEINTYELEKSGAEIKMGLQFDF